MARRLSTTLLLVVPVALLAFGCVVDWDRAGTPGNVACAAGEKDCTLDCSKQPCTASCGDAISCHVDCAAGGCQIDCGESSICTADCAGGGCAQECSGALSCSLSCLGVGAACTQSCAGSGCECSGCE